MWAERNPARLKGTWTRHINASSSTSRIHFEDQELTAADRMGYIEITMDYIEIANKKDLEKFVGDYLPAGTSWKSWTHPKTGEKYEVTISTAKALSGTDFEDCFNLIFTTSGEAYKASKDGWKPRSKKKEMRLLDLKYLLVKKDNKVVGFTSFMPTYEDEYPVIYCYEIHISLALQGTGLGTVLMGLLEVVGHEIPGAEKTMLTCFVSNEWGIKFYEKLGYGKDEFSPPPKLLRNGTKVEADYVILSKAIQR